jgi:hypothetical protein
MPAQLHLQLFGDMVTQAFGEIPYHVGSSLTGNVWRDVDVRVMLPDEQYAALGLGDPRRPQANAKWCAWSAAFSALGRQMTGLPIDFQIQDMTVANEEHPGARSALLMCAVRRGGTILVDKKPASD